MAYRLNLFSMLKRRIRESKDSTELRRMAVELRDFANVAESRAVEVDLKLENFVMPNASERVQ